MHEGRLNGIRSGTRLHRIWLASREMAIVISFFAADDRRPKELDLALPKWLWRPYCWIDGGHDPYYGDCVICGKPLERGADGVWR